MTKCHTCGQFYSTSTRRVGAYVQAWVWVYSPGEGRSDAEYRQEAKAAYRVEGEIEIDNNAPVSRSCEGA